MDDDEAAIIGIGLIIVVAIFIIGIIAGLVNSLQNFLISIGFPQQLAGELGSILFFGILLFIIIQIIKGLVS